MKILGWCDFSDWKINLKNTFAICDIGFHVRESGVVGVGGKRGLGRRSRGARIARHISHPPWIGCLPAWFHTSMQIKPVISGASFTPPQFQTVLNHATLDDRFAPGSDTPLKPPHLSRLRRSLPRKIAKKPPPQPALRSTAERPADLKR